MEEYIVQSPIKSGGKRREIGEKVELDDAVAARLVENGNVVPMHGDQQYVDVAIQKAARALANGEATVGKLADEVAAMYVGQISSGLVEEIGKRADRIIADREAKAEEEQRAKDAAEAKAREEAELSAKEEADADEAGVEERALRI